MSRFSALLLPVFLLAALAPGQALACGKGCGKKEMATEKNRRDCCAKDESAACCGAPDAGSHAGRRDADGHCDGKCGAGCNCPCAHASAIAGGIPVFAVSGPAFASGDFFYRDPFLSRISLDIWLPPNIRA